ncbi:MAG: hypothetical protein ACI9LO_002123 [Planctomycetota bacterium]|jgi:hypothetical protein
MANKQNDTRPDPASFFGAEPAIGKNKDHGTKCGSSQKALQVQAQRPLFYTRLGLYSGMIASALPGIRVIYFKSVIFCNRILYRVNFRRSYICVSHAIKH